MTMTISESAHYNVIRVDTKQAVRACGTPLPEIQFTLEPEEKTTTPDGTIIFAVSAGGSALVLVLIIAIALCLRRKSRSSPRNSPEEVDENHMYGTYGYGDDPDYITAEDSNPYYGSSDM